MPIPRVMLELLNLPGVLARQIESPGKHLARLILGESRPPDGEGKNVVPLHPRPLPDILSESAAIAEKT